MSTPYLRWWSGAQRSVIKYAQSEKLCRHDEQLLTLTPEDVGSELAQCDTYCRNERQRLYSCIRLLHTRPIPPFDGVCCPNQDRPLYITSSALRARAHSGQWLSADRRAVCALLFRDLGQARAVCCLCRPGPEGAYQQTRLFPLPHAHGLSYIQSRRR